MKIKSLPYLALLLFTLTSNAQFTETFEDGNFSANPVWKGNPGDWTINTALQLQSSNTVANSNYYLSTPSTLATSAQWEIYVGLSFNTSAANYIDIYLTASASDLTNSTTSGYLVRVGNSDDEISLYRKATTGIITKIIDGANGITGAGNNTLKIKVVRDAASQWTLYRDITGTGNAFFAEGSVTDTTFSSSAFFGILVKQSTASFFKHHFFDDIIVKPYSADIIAPVIQTVTVLSANTIDVLFNEPLDKTSSQVPANYVVNNSFGSPVTVVLDPINIELVHLTFTSSFNNAFNYELSVNNVKDLAGNSMINGSAGFIYFQPYTPQQYDVVIDEIMADPSPVVNLPNNEWIELKNISGSAINLQGWRIGDITGLSGPMPNFILSPDSMVILCANTAFAAMSVFGTSIPVPGFPSLDNTMGQLYIRSSQNKIIHSVSYKNSWYQNELKKPGGWSLEMIDTKNPCSGFSNWKASIDTRGGSPGKKNAVDAVNPDYGAPNLLSAYTMDSMHVILVFNEPLDSLEAADPANFSISDGIVISSAPVALSPSFDRVDLKLSTPLLRDKVYTITISSVTDCVGNKIGNKNTARVGISEIAAASDIVINEILFNPSPRATDYVEIYNRSNKIIDLKQTYIANRNGSSVISNIVQLSEESNLLFPQDFMVITESAALVKAAYITQNTDAFLEIGSMPSFNNDKGTVDILNAQGEVTDELAYNENWHFKLIDNRQGVALERIDYNASTQSGDNWHSAATSAGYGTPGYKNSQYLINDGIQGEVKLSPEIISPDNDGQDDFATIDYNFPEPGYVANITIFDASGRPVRYLQRNALCGTKGIFRWDGLGEKTRRLAIGIYVVFTEVFNLKGNKKQFKTAIVLARRG